MSERSKPVMSLDLDDVLFDTQPYLLDKFNQHFGLNVPLDAFEDLDATRFFPVNMAEAIALVNEILMSDDSVDELRPIEGAVEMVADLSEHFDFAIVTARQYAHADVVRKLADAHFPTIPHRRILFTGVKDGSNYTLKSFALRELNSIGHVDDKVSIVREVAGSVRYPVLFGDNGWNQQNAEGLVRIESHAMLTDYLGTIATGGGVVERPQLFS